MDLSSPLVKLAIAAGLAFAAYKYSSNMAVKGAALGVLGVMVAKKIPFLQDALA